MLVIDFDIVNVPLNPLQLENAPFSMLVTESGIIKFPVKPLQP